MSDTKVHKWEARDAAVADSQWGMNYMPESRTKTPAQLASEARDRGDRLFQIDLVISVTQGFAQIGSAGTRTYRPMEGSDWIGPIEDQGWHLDQFSTTYVQQGSSGTKRVLANAGSTEVAGHGVLVGVYVFRRASS